jgi:hypothetical protein
MAYFTNMSRQQRKDVFNKIKKGGVGAFSTFLEQLMTETEKQAYSRALQNGVIEIKEITKEAISKTLKEQFKFGEIRQQRFFENFETTLDDINIYIARTENPEQLENRKLTYEEKQAYMIIRCLHTFILNLLMTEETKKEFYQVPDVYVKLTNILAQIQAFDKEAKIRINPEHYEQLNNLLATKYLYVLSKEEKKKLPKEDYINFSVEEWFELIEEILHHACRKCDYDDCSNCKLRKIFINRNLPVAHPQTVKNICEYSTYYLNDRNIKDLEKQKLNPFVHQCRYIAKNIKIDYNKEEKEWFMTETNNDVITFESKLDYCPYCGEKLPYIYNEMEEK